MKRPILAGKTYGNRVVRTASQDHPERVLGVIVIGAGGEVLPEKKTMLNERGDDIKRLMVEFILHTPSDAVRPATP